MKIEIKLNFNVIDKLPIEQQRKLEEKCLKILTDAIYNAEKDYCRKKGVVYSDKVLMDYPFYLKMMKAINKRKQIILLTETCMMFNPLIRNFTPMKFYKEK